MSTNAFADWREVLIVDAALRTGLLAAFREPVTPEDAAAPLGLDPRAARIVAVALADLGYLQPAGLRRYAWGEQAVAMLDDAGAERDLAGRLHLTARSIALHLGLADTLRGDRPPPPWTGDHRAMAEFMAAMRAGAGTRSDDLLVALARPHDGARLLDVGGAPGGDAAALAAAGWDVSVLDLPQALEVTGDALRAAGVTPVPGDATEALPEGPWDAVLIANVLQLLGEEQAAGLVARAAAVLAPGGTLAVCGVMRDLSPHGRLFAVQMLLSTDAGDSHDSEAIIGWMQAAGLRDVSADTLANGAAIVRGRAA